MIFSVYSLLSYNKAELSPANQCQFSLKMCGEPPVRRQKTTRCFEKSFVVAFETRRTYGSARWEGRARRCRAVPGPRRGTGWSWISSAGRRRELLVGFAMYLQLSSCDCQTFVQVNCANGQRCAVVGSRGRQRRRGGEGGGIVGLGPERQGLPRGVCTLR